MFSESTQLSVTALVNVDPTATDAEKKRVMDALAGGSFKERVAGMLTYKEAARRLCRRDPNYVCRLVKAKRLKPVIGLGDKAIGVTAQSVEEFIMSGGSSAD